MSTTISRWPSTGLVPFDLSTRSWLPLLASPIRVEERIDGQTYVMRAELPGVNPTQDIKIMYYDGTLRLQVQRIDERKDRTRTEFRYGSYGRTVTLPEGTDEHSIRATYTDGILEIRAMIVDPEMMHRPIAIEDSDAVTPVATKPAEAKPAEVKPAEAKLAEVKPAEAKPAVVKPAEVKPAEAKPAEAKLGEVKPAEAKPTAVKPGTGKRAASGTKR